MRVASIVSLATTLLFGVVACDQSESKSAVRLYDSSVTEWATLGWLGGEAQTLLRAVDVEADGESLEVGGVALRSVTAEGPLASAGAQVGDVIVRVSEDWVPIKEDPTLDIIAMVERAISSGDVPIEIALQRSGALTTVSIDAALPALEVGLPVEVERFERGAASAIEWLLAQQRENGGFDAPGASELAVNAMAGLALLANGADEAALERVTARVLGLLESDENDENVENLTHAVMFLSERAGGLSAAILVRAAEMAGPGLAMAGGPGGGPGGLPPGLLASLAGGGGEISMEQLQELMASGSGSMSFSMTGPGGEESSGDEIPPEVLEQIMAGGGEGVEVITSGALPPGVVPGENGIVMMPGGPPPSGVGGDPLAGLIDELEPARSAHLERLEPIVARLTAQQAEDGGWGTGDDELDRVTMTCQALTALGMAQRVGLTIEDAESVERGVTFLRGQVHDGRIAAAVARGADRRIEAGKAAQAAVAMMSLGCADSDDFTDNLRSYAKDQGEYVVAAPSGAPFHVLAMAILRRSGGLVSWQSFYDEFRYALVAAQTTNGAFEGLTGTAPSALETSLANDVYRTSLGAILLALQSEESAPVLVGKAENPFAPVIDGHGKRAESGGGGEAAPPAGMMMPELPPGVVLPEGAEIRMVPEPPGG